MAKLAIESQTVTVPQDVAESVMAAQAAMENNEDTIEVGVPVGEKWAYRLSIPIRWMRLDE